MKRGGNLMRISNITLLAAAVAVLLTTALSAQDKKKAKTKAIVPEKVDLGRPVDFQKDIAPILEANCVACHNVAIDESKLSLEDVKSIMKGGKRGPAVIAKQPDKSWLYLAASRSKAPAMPPLPNKVDARALTPKELGLIRQWILEGATVGMGAKGTAVTFYPLPVNLQPIYSVALSPWARYAAAGRANQIYVYNVVTGEEVAVLKDPALDPIQFEGKPMYPGGAAHRDFVHSLAFSPDGNLLASGGFRTVKLWQKQDGTKKYQVAAGNAVTAVAVSPDGKLAAVGAADNSIQLVDAKTGKVAKKLTGHTAAVNSVSFSADGSKLVSGSADKTVRVWDIAKGAEIRKVTSPAAVNDAVFNKDATQFISADADNILRVWPTVAPAPKKDAKKDPKKKPEAEKPVAEMKGHAKPVTSVALVLPQGTQVISGSEDGTVRMWNISNGQAVRTMNHGAPVTDVAVKPDGQLYASASANGIGKLWRTNGQQLAELKGRVENLEKIAAAMEEQAVAKQRLTNRDADVKTAEKNVKDREAAAKKAKDAKAAADKAYAAAEKKAKPLMDALAKANAALAKNPKDKALQKKASDAQKAAAKPTTDLEKAKNTRDAADRSLKLADKSVVTAKGKLDEANKAKTAADAVVKKADAELKAVQGASNAAAKPMRSIEFSQDGNTVVTAGDEGLVQLWSSADGQPAGSFTAHKAAIADAVISSDGTILTASADKTAAAWSANPSWKLVARLGVPADKPLDLSSSPFVGRVLALDFSRDGKLLATGGGDPSRSGELFIWDVAKRSLLREIKDAHSDTILGLQFNWDGTRILSGAADKFAKIHDVATGKHIRSFEGHTHHVLDVAWQADESTIVTAGADNVIKIWNARTGEQRKTVAGYNKQVTSIQYIGVGQNFVACSGDAIVNLHRASNGQAYRRMSGASDYVYASAAGSSAAAIVANVNSEATVVIAGGEDGVLHVWNGNGQSIKNFEPPKPPGGEKKQASLSKAGK